MQQDRDRLSQSARTLAKIAGTDSDALRPHHAALTELAATLEQAAQTVSNLTQQGPAPSPLVDDSPPATR